MSPTGTASQAGLPRLARARVRLRRLLRAVGPAMAMPSGAEPLRAGIGAGFGLLACGLIVAGIGRAMGDATGMLLIAPLGATAFLVFAVPNSPLAQPWSAIVGNGVAALVAVTVLGLGLAVEPAAAIAVCGAIVAMALARAMHPPGAAVALAIVLAASIDEPPGYDFVLAPVLLDTVLLVCLAVIYNRFTGRRYPFRQTAPQNRHRTADPEPDRRLGLTPEDLSQLLSRFRLTQNIGAEDLGRIISAAEEAAARRIFDDLTCSDVMSRDVVTVAPQTRLGTVAELFRRHDFKSLPVVADGSRLRGLITQNDLIQHARRDALGRGGGFAAAMRRMADATGLSPMRAGDVMRTEIAIVSPGDGIGGLIGLMADKGAQAVPVVDHDRLVGIVTRSDLIALLARRSLLTRPDSG